MLTRIPSAASTATHLRRRARRGTTVPLPSTVVSIMAPFPPNAQQRNSVAQKTRQGLGFLLCHGSETRYAPLIGTPLIGTPLIGIIRTAEGGAAYSYFGRYAVPVSCLIAVSGAAMLSRDLRSALTPIINSTSAAATMSPAATR